LYFLRFRNSLAPPLPTLWRVVVKETQGRIASNHGSHNKRSATTCFRRICRREHQINPRLRGFVSKGQQRYCWPLSGTKDRKPR
jgi:hypothetical protein